MWSCGLGPGALLLQDVTQDMQHHCSIECNPMYAPSFAVRTRPVLQPVSSWCELAGSGSRWEGPNFAVQALIQGLTQVGLGMYCFLLSCTAFSTLQQGKATLRPVDDHLVRDVPYMVLPACGWQMLQAPLIQQSRAAATPGHASMLRRIMCIHISPPHGAGTTNPTWSCCGHQAIGVRSSPASLGVPCRPRTAVSCALCTADPPAAHLFAGGAR